MGVRNRTAVSGIGGVCNGGRMDFAMPWDGDSGSGGLLTLRSMAHLPGHHRRADTLLPYFRRLRLLPVLSSSDKSSILSHSLFYCMYLNSHFISGVSFGQFLAPSVRMRFFLWNITAAIDPIQSCRYTSLLAVAVGVLLLLLTSFSDPGIINAGNVSQYLSAYPYDNIIYSEKECPTCQIPKPARSKHCSICDRCVARFDHHCGWMVHNLTMLSHFILSLCGFDLKIWAALVRIIYFQNNCIGERNTQFFMAFLCWHFLPCLYGTVAIGLIVSGKLQELRIVHILTLYYGVENSFLDLAPHIAQWLLGSYNNLILTMVFLSILGMLLAGFFGYHAKLCLSNTTTNETFKWQEYIRCQRKLNEAGSSDAVPRASMSGTSKWKAFFRRSSRDKVAVPKNNIYDRGFIYNVQAVIFPYSTRRSFIRTKSKPG